MLALCSWYDVPCHIGKIKDAFVEGVEWTFDLLFGLVYDFIVKIISEAVGFIVKTVGTIWIKVPTPGIAEGNYEPTPVIAFMQGRIMWLAIACATLSLIIAGIRMAFTMRGESATALGKSMLTFLIVSAFSVGFVSVLIKIADGFADWVIGDAVSGNAFEQRVENMFKENGEAALLFALVLGVLAICTSIIQIGLMFVRNGMLIILIGVLPLAAAATNTEMGKAWFRKLTGWLVAFLAYKPVAALIYGAALQLWGAGSGWYVGMTGLAMMVMALIAMPALIRFVSPSSGG